MTEKEVLILDNIMESMRSVSDTKDLLKKNRKTKRYVENYEKFLKKYMETLNFADADEFENMMIDYENSIQLSVFLKGFQIGFNAKNTINSNSFVDEIMDRII